MYSSNPFLTLAHQNGDLQEAYGASLSKPQRSAPDEVLRDARERNMMYKTFVAVGNAKPGGRGVSMARIQFGDGLFESEVQEMMRLLPSPRQSPLPEMEEPVPVTRTLMRSVSMKGPRTLRAQTTPSVATPGSDNASPMSLRPMPPPPIKAADDEVDDSRVGVSPLLRSASRRRYHGILGSCLQSYNSGTDSDRPEEVEDVTTRAPLSRMLSRRSLDHQSAGHVFLTAAQPSGGQPSGGQPSGGQPSGGQPSGGGPSPRFSSLRRASGPTLTGEGGGSEARRPRQLKVPSSGNLDLDIGRSPGSGGGGGVGGSSGAVAAVPLERAPRRRSSGSQWQLSRSFNARLFQARSTWVGADSQTNTHSLGAADDGEEEPDLLTRLTSTRGAGPTAPVVRSGGGSFIARNSLRVQMPPPSDPAAATQQPDQSPDGVGGSVLFSPSGNDTQRHQSLPSFVSAPLPSQLGPGDSHGDPHRSATMTANNNNDNNTANNTGVRNVSPGCKVSPGRGMGPRGLTTSGAGTGPAVAFKAMPPPRRTTQEVRAEQVVRNAVLTGWSSRRRSSGHNLRHTASGGPWLSDGASAWQLQGQPSSYSRALLARGSSGGLQAGGGNAGEEDVEVEGSSDEYGASRGPTDSGDFEAFLQRSGPYRPEQPSIVASALLMHSADLELLKRQIADTRPVPPDPRAVDGSDAAAAEEEKDSRAKTTRGYHLPTLRAFGTGSRGWSPFRTGNVMDRKPGAA